MGTPPGRDEGGRTQARAPPGHNPLPTPHQFSRTVTPGVAQWGGDVTVPGSDSSPFTACGPRACRCPAPLLTTSWPHPGHPSCLVDSRQSCSPGARPPSPPGGVVPVLRARWPCPRSHCNAERPGLQGHQEPRPWSSRNQDPAVHFPPFCD